MNHKISKFRNSFCITLAILSYLFLPILFLIIYPLVLSHRFIIYLSAKYLRPELGGMLSPLSSMFVSDDLFNKPSSAIAFGIILDGQFSISKIYSRIEILLNSDKYPELKQSITSWCGFQFWKNNSDFSIGNHLSCDETQVDLNFIKKFQDSLVVKPFVKGKPLWEMFLFPNCICFPDEREPTKRSVTVIRFHHSLADGYSMLNLMDTMLSQDNQQSLYKTLARPNFDLKKSILQWIKFISLANFHVVYNFMRAKSEQNCLKNLNSENQVCNRWDTGNKVSMELIKNIGITHKVRVSSVIISAVAAAIRNGLIKVGKPIPEKIFMSCPFPLPSHPKRLTNHMAFVPFEIPVGEPESLKRLHIINETFESIKHSTIPFGFAALFSLVGGLCNPILKKVLKLGISFGSVIMTNFPGPATTQKYLGLEITDFIFTGAQTLNIGLGFNALSYNGIIKFGVRANTSLFPDPYSAQQFTEFIIQELHTLAKGSEILNV